MTLLKGVVEKYHFYFANNNVPSNSRIENNFDFSEWYDTFEGSCGERTFFLNQ